MVDLRGTSGGAWGVAHPQKRYPFSYLGALFLGTNMLRSNLQYILKTVIFRYLQGYAQHFTYFHCIECLQ